MTRAALALLLTLAALGACGSDEPSKPGKTDGDYEVIHVDVDGRDVPCVIWDGYQSGAISCDWTAK